MAEQKQMEMLSALMGEEGQDAAKMLLRMQRLQRLLGAPQDTALPPAPQEEPLRLRQRKLLQAVEKYVSQQERGQVRLLLKMMDMKEILGQGE